MASSREGRKRQRSVSIVGTTILCGALAACVQSAGTNTRTAEPIAAASVVATSDPLVLSGVAYTQGDVPAQTAAIPPPSANSNIFAAPAAGSPQPLVSSMPLPPTDPSLALPPVTSVPAVTAPVSTPPRVVPPPPPMTAPVATADGYPNINITPQPKQPQSKLLTPEERAKLIEELNALAGSPASPQ